MFYDLLNEAFGSLDNLEKHEKEYRRLKQQQNLKNENLICAYTALLPNPNNVNVCGVKKNKEQKQERMRRARSMPKMNEQDLVSIFCFRFMI